MDEKESYLQFLRYSLDEKAPIPSDISQMDWEKLYLFARNQTVESTYWQGIERLDRMGVVKLSETAVLTWMARVKKVEKKNRTAYKKVGWVWNNFKREGFRSCVLKGQGNALLYPTPFLRTSGDIDIWVEGGDKKVIAYIDSIMPGRKRSYHHIEFIKTGDYPIEVHYRPSWMSNPIHNKRLQAWFESKSDRCFSHLNEEWGFCSPTYEFNTIYLLSHLYSHLLREGVGLRHIVDYYHLLNTYPDGERKPTEKEIRALGMHKICSGLMWVLHDVLGLKEEKLLCKPNERIGKLLLNEILTGGNFGKYDERAMGGVSSNSFQHNVKVSWRDLHLLRYFPSECLFEPYHRLWHYFWRLRHKPKVTPESTNQHSEGH